jgi:hypothetical protein
MARPLRIQYAGDDIPSIVRAERRFDRVEAIVLYRIAFP